MKLKILTKLPSLLILLFLLSASAGAAGEQSIPLPVMTETDCEWDEAGNLVRETAHTLDGQPALNSRGFYRAEYMWDVHSNLLSEVYYGLDGNFIDTDTGYAWARYTYYKDRSGRYQVLTEDRYAADGSRASIPGSYSYRRDTWQGQELLATEYFDASGRLTRPMESSR